jgi:hypothetical protein
MPSAQKTVRRSVSLPAGIARRVKSLAASTRTSVNQAIVALIETGLDAREREKKHFLKVADRLTCSHDVGEQKRCKEELARMTFRE